MRFARSSVYQDDEKYLGRSCFTPHLDPLRYTGLMPETMPVRRLFTPDEYLIIERRAEFKSEYLDGEIFAMSGATSVHNRIAGNVFMEVGLQLKGKPCQHFMSDMRIGVTM